MKDQILLEMSDSEDLFANTQKSVHSGASKDGKLEYPKLIVYKWVGDVDSPFEIVTIDELDPNDVDSSWTAGVLSPKSRAKSQHLKCFPDHSVSIFGKIEKSK